jgi:hypothetical protein
MSLWIMFLNDRDKTLNEMKTLTKYLYLFILPLALAGALLSSCDNEDELENGGEPTIYYVRVTSAESSDSLVTSAFLGNLVAIMGDNLAEARHLYFNDKEAILTPTFITNTSILVRIPNEAPIDINNKIKLVFRDGTELLYDFLVSIPPPEVLSMDLEYVPDGGTAYINGLYFFDVTPVKVEFSDGAGGFIPAQVVATTERRLEVVVPAGAGSGPLKVTTNFGVVESVLHFRDERNIILNYDEPGKTPVGSWRTGIIVSDENSLDGNYVKFEGVYNAGERTEGEGSPYESQFWGQASGRPESNLLPGEPTDYYLKFEVNVVEWFGSHLNICFAPWNHTGNQEIWGNDLNARAVWGPWEATGAPVKTDGQWVTVTIPMTEFKWAMGLTGGQVTYTEMKFNKAVTGSLSMWVLSAPEANASPFKFYIDNIRIVPNK